MPSINDRNDWKTVKNALQIMDFDESTIEVKLHRLGKILTIESLQY